MTQPRLDPIRLNMGLDRLGSTWARVNSAQLGTRPTLLYVGLGVLDQRWAWADSTWPGPGGDLTWPGLDSTRHGPGLTRLDMGPGRLNSTSAQANLTRHRLRPTRLDIGLGRLNWTLAWTDSVWHWLGPTQLDIGRS